MGMVALDRSGNLSLLRELWSLPNHQSKYCFALRATTLTTHPNTTLWITRDGLHRTIPTEQRL